MIVGRYGMPSMEALTYDCFELKFADSRALEIGTLRRGRVCVALSSSKQGMHDIGSSDKRINLEKPSANMRCILVFCLRERLYGDQ